ncbi:dihydroorotate oxidase B, catalytic subunit [Desulfonispora thiosulfatigenes DSM 11270]|uniref:Dihydroorotate dehydrogenase n=1 Tax=Desulfonispora thiosulfatigenes DSM 11270 TaxID=656914 RepID=A0A1W1VGX8_DESTI|nr:dihydroorotate dehydrogenase [Desulfonispora thiosulfatigenes]SMB92618.1 dihydroorotate oxidase B, catalytic subunit [Desulfonispora thiosulfatigenes DSM 11270]
MSKVNLSQTMMGINFENPVLTASGTYGFGTEYNEIIDVSKLGGIVSKGLTLESRKGNPGVRLKETPSGLLNCIGLENPGVEKFITDYLPKMIKLNTKIIANISGNTLDDYKLIAEKLDLNEINALEVNISCPNVKAGGMAFGTDAKMVEKVTNTVKSATSLPVIVKLSPNVTDITEMALAAESGGADGLALINTLLGMSVDINRQKPSLGNVFGGLSGPAIKPVALRMVWQVFQKVNIPIIGLGGISKWEDAVEFMLAGASLVMVGTSNFSNPLAPLEIIEGIEKYCEKNNLSSVSDLIGLAQKGE